ncbi:hypothetical protein Droror1_Dr00012501 [Drosera rotundifolia]
MSNEKVMINIRSNVQNVFALTWSNLPLTIDLVKVTVHRPNFHRPLNLAAFSLRPPPRFSLLPHRNSPRFPSSANTTTAVSPFARHHFSSTEHRCVALNLYFAERQPGRPSKGERRAREQAEHRQRRPGAGLGWASRLARGNFASPSNGGVQEAGHGMNFPNGPSMLFNPYWAEHRSILWTRPSIGAFFGQGRA